MRHLIAMMIAIAAGWASAQTPPPDPTRPPSPAEIRAWFSSGQVNKDDIEYRLQSVLTAPGRRIAIINGQRLQVGDRLGEARVESIDPRRVVLATQDGRVELNLDALRNPLN